MTFPSRLAGLTGGRRLSWLPARARRDGPRGTASRPGASGEAPGTTGGRRGGEDGADGRDDGAGSPGSPDRTDTLLAALGWLGVLVLLVLTVVPGLGSSHVFLATDMLRVIDPWAVADGTEVTNRVSWDTIDSAAPMALLITESVRAGDLPLWDPYTNGGTMLAALPNSGLLSPLSLPWWILPATAASAGVKLMEVAAVALGMHGLLRRRWGLPRLTVPFATLVYTTSGFMVAWTNWPQTRVAAMIPLLMWVTDRLAVERTWRDIAPMALVIASMLLGGFPAVVVYSLLVAVAFFLVRAVACGSALAEVVLGLARSAAGVVLGACLAGLQILPFVWQSLHYVDFGSRAESASDPLPLESLVTALVPGLLGGPGTAHSRSLAHPVEGFSYVGAAALLLVALTLLVRSRRRPPRGVPTFLLVALVVLVVAVYDGGPLLTLLQEIPGVGSSPIGRMRSVIGLLAAVLAACGLAAVYDARGLVAQLLALRTTRLRGVAAGGARLVLAAGLLVFLVLLAFNNQDPQDVEASWQLIRPALLVLVVCAAVLGLAWVLPRRWTAAGAVVVVLWATTVTSVDVARHWWPLSDSSTFYPTTATHKVLDDRLGQDRYASLYTAMMPGTSTAYRQRSLTGHSFVSPEWSETMALVSLESVKDEDGSMFQTPTYSTLPVGALQGGLHSGVLDRYGVRYVVAPMSEYLPGRVDTRRAGEATTTSVLRADGTTLRSAVFSGPVRGVVLDASSFASLRADDGLLAVRVVSEDDGSTLATSISSVEGAPGLDGYVYVAGEDIPARQSWHVEVGLSQTEGSLSLGVLGNGRLALFPYRPVDDGTRLVHAGDAVVVERLTALDRVRWASTQTVIEDAAERGRALEEGDLDAGTVVLEDPADAQDLTKGSTATITEEDEGTDVMELDVDSDGAGWVVIADPLRDGGWSATLDGQPAELVDAENAAVAVYVPHAGHHTIRLEYEAPWFRAGLALSAVAGLVVLALLGLGLWQVRSAAAVARRPGRGAAGSVTGPAAAGRSRRRVRTRRAGLALRGRAARKAASSRRARPVRLMTVTRPRRRAQAQVPVQPRRRARRRGPRVQARRGRRQP